MSQKKVGNFRRVSLLSFACAGGAKGGVFRGQGWARCLQKKLVVPGGRYKLSL